MRTSFPWTITPHFRRDCKTEWGDGYCRGGRLCPSSAVTQRFVGQGPCALPGVEVPGSGVRAPRPTHHLPIEFHKGRRPPTVVPVNWGTFSNQVSHNPGYAVLRQDVCQHIDVLFLYSNLETFLSTLPLAIGYFSPRQSRRLSLVANARRRPPAIAGCT